MTYFSRFGRAVAACFVATLAAFLLAGRIDATSIRLPLSEISARSPVVVHGRVERIESAWNGERQIESTVYVRASEILRGPLPNGALIPVRVYGGTIDGLTMVSSEEPEFEAGEDVLLFLSISDGRAYRPTADQQGKFKVLGDRAVNRAWQAGLRLAELKDGVVHGRWSAGTALPDASFVPSESPTESPLHTAPASGATAAETAPDSYVLTGSKWFGPQPMEEYFLVNVNTDYAGTANGSAEEFRNAILAAAYTWSNAGAAFSFKYGGLTGATSWSNDNMNVIYWENLGSSPTLAQAQWWTTNGRIIDADLRFNDYYAWDVTGGPSRGEPDLQSVATHELGHWLSLGHDTDVKCPDSSSVMCPSYNLGTTKWTLGANDVAGIKAIYGSIAPATYKFRLFLPLLSR